jgi:hypothetical protein
MAWKPKEKELTLEEAVELARKELASDWHGSPPLLAAVPGPAGPGGAGTVNAHPLEPAFAGRSWLMFFLDPLDFDGQIALDLARDFQKRYAGGDEGAGPGLALLCFLQLRYRFQREPGWLEQLARAEHLSFPLVHDRGGLLARAFSVPAFPRLLLLDRGKTLFETQVLEHRDRTENEIQRFLRSRDPGLPLPRPVKQSPARPRSAAVAALELGAAASPAPGYFMRGRWQKDEDSLNTADPSAELSFSATGPAIGLIARTESRIREPARIVVEIDGTPLLERERGADVVFDDEGASSCGAIEPRLYALTRGLANARRKVTLRFPEADRVPVRVYSARFGETGN